jgi:hypothetical protein
MRIVTWNLGANSAGYAVRHAEAWEYVLDVIYQVLCNLFHGGKRANNVRDDKLVRTCALVSRSPSLRALVEGLNGPELHSTKNNRTYRVELDAETSGVLMEHRSRSEARARRSGVELAEEAFVFSLRAEAPRRGFRTG